MSEGNNSQFETCLDSNLEGKNLNAQLQALQNSRNFIKSLFLDGNDEKFEVLDKKIAETQELLDQQNESEKIAGTRIPELQVANSDSGTSFSVAGL